MRRRLTAGSLALALSVAPVAAEYRITSDVHVKRESPYDGISASLVLAGFLNGFPLHLGRARLTTLVARGQVRVDGAGPILGLAPDSYLLFRPEGGIVGVQPSTRTYFILDPSSARVAAGVMQYSLQVNPPQRGGTLVGYRAERVTHTFAPGPRPTGGDGLGMAMTETGASVPAWTLNESDEERARRWMRDNRRSERHRTIQVQTWTSSALPAPLLAVAKTANPVVMALTGEAHRVETGFALRQIVKNPDGGYSLESRVTRIEEAALEDDLFEIPATFTRTEPPSVRPRRVQ